MQFTLTSDRVSTLEHQWTLASFSPELRDALLENWATSCAKVSVDGGKTFNTAFILHLPSEGHRQTRAADDIVRKLYGEILDRTDIHTLVVSSPVLTDLIWSRESLAS